MNDEFTKSATYAVDSDGDDNGGAGGGGGGGGDDDDDNDDRLSVAESEQSMVSEAPNDDVDDQRPPWLPFPVEETDAVASGRSASAVQTSSAHTNTLAVHASQSREAIDGVIERVLARSLFPNIPMRKAAPTVYFYGARRVVITESGNPAMPHVKSGRFDGSLEDFFAQNGKTEIVRIRGLKAAINMMSQKTPQAHAVQVK